MRRKLILTYPSSNPGPDSDLNPGSDPNSDPSSRNLSRILAQILARSLGILADNSVVTFLAYWNEAKTEKERPVKNIESLEKSEEGTE